MRFSTSLLLSILFTGLSASGCTMQKAEYASSEGDFCLSTTPAAPGPAGEARWILKADVFYDGCASGCSKVKSECKASLNGSTIELLPSAVVTKKRGGDCTTDCVVVKAQCTLETPLAAGSYSVTSRQRNFQAVVPAKVEPCGPHSGLQPGTGTLTTPGSQTATNSSST